MQLIGAIVSDHKSVRRAEVPLNGLTVLLGPNGAGKTNLLEAIGSHDPLARKVLGRSVASAARRSSRLGLVHRFVIDADGLGRDAEHVLDMLASPWAAGVDRDDIAEGVGAYCGSNWWLEGGDLYDADSRASLTAAYQVIKHHLLKGADQSKIDLAEELLQLLFDEPLLIVQEDFAVELTCDRSARKGQRILELAHELRGAAAGVFAHALDPLTSWTGRWPPIILLSRGPSTDDGSNVPAGFSWFTRQLGGVQVISGDSDAAEAHLENTLPRAHDWFMHDPASPQDFPEDCGRCLLPDHGGRSDMRFYEDEDVDFGESNQWLEEVEGWVRVRPPLVSTLWAVEQVANRLSPPFVTEHGRIKLGIRSTTGWGGTAARTGITFAVRGADGEDDPATWGRSAGVAESLHAQEVEAVDVPLAELGAGIRRWVATAVRLAVDACADGSITIAGDLTDLSRLDISVASIRPRVLLIDEPEQHLHPYAQRVVADWTVEQSRRNHAVLVATHSPAFLALPPEEVTICQVQRRGHSTTVRPLPPVHGPDAVSRARELGFALGLADDALAQLTRAVVVVEGEWDRILIHHFYGHEVAEQRFLVVPLQGSNELAALADAAVIPALGVPVIALLDEVRATSWEDFAQLAGNLTKTERALRDLAVSLGDTLRIIRYEDPDVICALPEEAVRAAYPSAHFPGWSVMLAQWESAMESGEPELPFKRWALRSMGLPAKHRHPTVFFTAVLARSSDATPGSRFETAVKQMLGSA